MVCQIDTPLLLSGSGCSISRSPLANRSALPAKKLLRRIAYDRSLDLMKTARLVI